MRSPSWYSSTRNSPGVPPISIGMRPRIAPDAVLLVHDGAPGFRSRRSRRIASGSAARLRRRSCRARAPNSCASEITAIAGAVRVSPGEVRGHRDRQRRIPVRERIPAVHHCHAVALRCAACPAEPRGGRPSPPSSSTRPSKSRRNASSGANGFSARASTRSSRGAVVGKLRSVALSAPASSVSALKASSVTEANFASARLELCRLEEQLGGPQDRALDVVAPVLVARLDRIPGLGERLRQRRVVHDHRVARQVVEQRRGRLRRTAAGRTQLPPGASPSLTPR